MMNTIRLAVCFFFLINEYKGYDTHITAIVNVSILLLFNQRPFMRSINLNNFDMMGVKNKIYSSLSIKKGSSVILYRSSYVHYII